MGATIHAHIEVKKGDRWLHFAAPDVRRDYTLFAAVNGERIDNLQSMNIQPQATINGLPEDMTEVTQICYEQDKAAYRLHGEGVLTADDLYRLQTHLNELRGKQKLDEGYDLEEDIFHTYMDGGSIAAHRGWDDVRVVFWYDN